MKEEGVDYDEVFAPVAPNCSNKTLFWRFASSMGFMSNQMDSKCILIWQHHRKKLCQTASRFLRSCSSKQAQKCQGTLMACIKPPEQKDREYHVNRTIKPASTPIEAHKSLGKDVDVHLYKSMIGCLMYLTAQTDIMYLKHQPHLGLWYPKDSPFHLEAFSDSDYAGDNHDRRSTSGGCQYLGRRLVSWQCKKQTIVAISSTEAEYVAAASCCAQVLWMQNQLLDYGFNFMNTEIHIDNESTICIVKNPVFHSKTKHIQIRHHFIRDCYEQRLINVVKVHTDDNVADLLTKGFDLARFNFLVQPIRADLLFDDENGVDCFPKQVIWDTLRDIGYEDASQTSGGDEGLLDIYALNREVKRLKRQTLSQAKLIIKLKAKLKKLSKFVAPVVKHHALWVENQNLKKQKRRRKRNKKKVSSVKLGRNTDGTEILSEEHNVQEEDTTHHFFDDTADQDAAVTPDLERKSDGTEEVNIEEKEASNVKSGETEELDLETTQSTARQGTITPRTLNFEDEAVLQPTFRPIPSYGQSEEQHNAAEVLLLISRPKVRAIPGPTQTQPQQPNSRALGKLTNIEEFARKIQAEWDAEEERKRERKGDLKQEIAQDSQEEESRQYEELAIKEA
ncbi:hypothetical protein Tco_0599450 [Tanacetum coccineum]